MELGGPHIRSEQDAAGTSQPAGPTGCEMDAGDQRACLLLFLPFFFLWLWSPLWSPALKA